MTSKTSIYNLTLRHLGVEAIESSDITDDTKNRAKVITDIYKEVRDQVLEAYNWKFALKRAYLLRDLSTFLPTNVNISTDVITVTAHTLVTGDRVEFSSTANLPSPLQASTTYYAIVLTTSTFQLATTRAFALVGTVINLTVVGTGTFTLYRNPLFEYALKFVMPLDALRIVSEYNNNEFEREGNFIYSDSSTMEVKYIFKAETEDDFDKPFVKAFALGLAAQAAYAITQNQKLADALELKYDKWLADARFLNAQEGKKQDFVINDFTDVRL